ncbi:MAG: hypothetical protein WCR55_01240 [Lentisphaerota bacterium]
MFDQDAYKIPKLKKEFQIQLNDGTKTLQKFIFFLNEYSKYSAEQQTILEFLNDEQTMVSSIQSQLGKNGIFSIINKNEICYILDDNVHPAPSATPQNEAVFVLKTGQKLNASIYQRTQAGQSRMIDYLSTPGQFVELVMDRKYFIYLNKNFILKVVL